MSEKLDGDELDRLFSGLSEGALTAGEHRRLQDLLAAHAEARQRWFRHCDLERGLTRWALARRTPAALAEVPVPANATPSRRTGQRPWAWAMAASFVAAALIGLAVFLPRAAASPVALLRRALEVHAAAVDHCYRLSFTPASAPAPGSAPPGRETRIWTRGDRFWNESRLGEKTAAWGRDEEGRVWFTPSPEVGAWFAADEVPDRLARLCDLRSLQPASLLGSLLADFDLRREPDAAGVQVVHAAWKAGHEHPRYHAALLEIDAASGVLRRLVVERVVAGRPPVPVTFTLVETSLLEASSYTLAGHLAPGATICDRHSAPGERGQVLAQLLTVLRPRPNDAPSPTSHR